MRQNYSDIYRELLKHALFATPFFLLGLGLILILGKLGVCMAFLLFIVGASIMGPPIARLLAEPVGGLVYFQGRDKDKPGPIYSQAEALRRAARYGEALAMYEKMTQAFPGEMKPYVEMIEIAVVDLKDGQIADRTFQKGIAAFEKREDDQKYLKARYEEILTRLLQRTGLPESIVPPEHGELDFKGRPQK